MVGGNLRLTFVIPDPDTFHSGGNLYNASLIQALREEGVSCTVGEPEMLPGRFTDLSSFFETEKELLLWDTLYLDQLEFLNPLQANWLIVHHLESLFPPAGISSRAWFEKNERSKLEQFDGYLVSSPFTAKYLQENGFDIEKILVITPALSFKPMVGNKDFDKVKALMVANVQHRKGIKPLLRALAKRPRIPGFSLTIAGSLEMEPEYAQSCLEFIENNPYLKEVIHFGGPKSPEEVIQLYEQSNLYISTAFMETYGMSLQEASAVGLPLLVLDGGNAANHVKEGENGFVLTDIHSLVAQLQQLTIIRALFEKVGRRAEALAENENYSWKTAAEKFIKRVGWI
jgi:glycosyltransferase involved in cell wall biosynthesis